MTKRLASWLAVLLVLSAPLARADKEKAKEHFRKGMARYTLEKWDEAIAEFELAYQEEPSPVFLYNIAQSHRLANRPRQAVEFYEKFLKKQPDSPSRADIEAHIAALRTTMAKTNPMQPKPGAAPGVAPRPQPAVAPQPEPVVVKPEPKPEPVVAPKPAPVVVASAKPEPKRVVRPEPKPAVVEKPTPPGAQDLGGTEPGASEAPKKRWPLWVGIAAGVVVVAGGAAVAGVMLTQPKTVLLPPEMVP